MNKWDRNLEHTKVESSEKIQLKKIGMEARDLEIPGANANVCVLFAPIYLNITSGAGVEQASPGKA